MTVLAVVGIASTASCNRGGPGHAQQARASKEERVEPATTGSERIRSLIERLRSQDESTRRAAMDELRQLGKGEGFSLSEGVQLLRATTLEFSGNTPGLWDTPTWMIAAVADEPRREYLPIIKELFPRWGISARERALDLLSGIDDAAAAETFMQLLRENASEISSPPLMRLQRQPHHPEVFFPGLLELVKHEAIANDVYLTTLNFCQEGLLPPDKLAGYAAPFQDAYRRERDWLRPKQRDKGAGWMWEEDYQEHRNRAALLLDLFSCLSIETVEFDLRDATSFRDARLAYFGAVSLLKHGKGVSADALKAVAASPEMRGSLYEELKKTHKIDLFPRRYLTQEAFAESEMVRWLVYPTELGRVPDEIELMKVVSADTREPDGILDYYVFRFRTFKPHWAAKDGWTAGVAGPFLRKDAPSPDAYGGTFSSFERWEAQTPEQHVGDIRALLEEWATHRAKEQNATKQ